MWTYLVFSEMYKVYIIGEREREREGCLCKDRGRPDGYYPQQRPADGTHYPYSPAPLPPAQICHPTDADHPTQTCFLPSDII